jgi:hypothetical protein
MVQDNMHNDDVPLHIQNIENLGPTGNNEICCGTNVSLRLPPPIIGYYYIGGQYHVCSFIKKPSWFHRKMTKILLGWDYINADL